MNKTDWTDVMQHDVRLWDMAEHKDNPDGTITKTLRNMPWGIGDLEVTLEGLDNAIKRREAVGSFANYVRDVIDERINDEAVEARATQAAALASPDPSELSVDVGPNRGAAGVGREREEVSPVANQEAVPAFEQPTNRTADPAHRLSELRTGVEGARAYIATASTEIKALEAYMEIINESTTGNEGPSEDA